ncbi:hypothetical protein Tco_0980972 [Tanacetum coccineum]
MSAASERVVLNTQLLPQPVNSVIVNPCSTPIDDHSDHDHNDVHVADECIPPPGFRCPAVSSDTRYAPAVNSRRAPTVNMATSRQQPPGSGPPSDYRYLGACSFSVFSWFTVDSGSLYMRAPLDQQPPFSHHPVIDYISEPVSYIGRLILWSTLLGLRRLRSKRVGFVPEVHALP